MKEKIREAYDKLAKDYELHVDKESGFNAYYERPAMLGELADDLAGLAVLDAGCAAGWYTEQCFMRGARVTAVDISPAMVAACRRRVENRADVRICDLSEPLPFDAEAFDWIVSSLTLHYVEDWSATFREFKRILKPGGKLLFSLHHPMMDMELMDKPDYFARTLLTDTWQKKEAGPVEVTFYRRPMQEIVNATAEHFVIERMMEPKPSPLYKEMPGARDWYAQYEERLSTRPHFLIVRALKNRQGIG
ncbi:class I SAM-dependent methyltransferase [Xylanibacillus composti]|uniref:Ubiquinone biosynthesis methyltransferase UbiE n=1 Tax=Xylanibacillus composti TaxID=1572762 RepID=A0A8J4H5Y9_9BACL|nr:class I SAM-dependent methyltransferase [Xylanibacillus composti]MDT9724312.1 class I SAM-dependent methyltransferase [Xylanibacillus composti]GIQ69308.1 ubiquinone biosynthesis methyltransferase UbiE [Xylanibacillus composti]